MKAGDTDEFRHLAMPAATFDVGDVMDRISDLTLDRGEGQTGVGLECQPISL